MWILNSPLFFNTVSPSHGKSSDWNDLGAMKCAKETSPLNSSPPFRMSKDRRVSEIAREVIEGMRVPVKVVNITAMSELRKDGHTSVYTTCQGKVLTADQKANPAVYADCIHWCLPRLPDTWNHLLYILLLIYVFNIVQRLRMIYRPIRKKQG